MWAVGCVLGELLNHAPLFVETVGDKIRANPAAGLVYYAFLLDMKGELAAGAAYDAALRAYETAYPPSPPYP